MIERTTTQEQIATAVGGSGHQDWVGALAYAQVSTGRAGAEILRGIIGPGAGSEALITCLAEHITRFQTAGNQVAYDRAKVTLFHLVERLNEARRWGLENRHMMRVAESSLLLHVHPKCTTCRGRQYEQTAFAKIECPVCVGTGNRPLPRKHRDQVAYVLNVLSLIQGLAERAVRRSLG